MKFAELSESFVRQIILEAENKNTHLVNLLFENRKLVRLIREKNNKS